MRMRNVLLAAMVGVALPAAAADRIQIANEGAIGDQWTPVPGTQFVPPYPEAYVKNPEEVCLVVGYLLNADGHTSDFALLKSWNSGGGSARSRSKFWTDFAGLASQALSLWQFAPKPEVASPRPVYTAATFVFGRPEDAAATREHCAISDLTTRLVELRYDARANRLMSQGIFTQLDIDPLVEERLRQQAVMHRESVARGRMSGSEWEQRPQQQQQPPPSSDNK